MAHGPTINHYAHLLSKTHIINTPDMRFYTKLVIWSGKPGLLQTRLYNLWPGSWPIFFSKTAPFTVQSQFLILWFDSALEDPALPIEAFEFSPLLTHLVPRTTLAILHYAFSQTVNITDFFLFWFQNFWPQSRNVRWGFFPLRQNLLFMCLDSNKCFSV